MSGQQDDKPLHPGLQLAIERFSDAINENIERRIAEALSKATERGTYKA